MPRPGSRYIRGASHTEVNGSFVFVRACLLVLDLALTFTYIDVVVNLLMLESMRREYCTNVAIRSIPTFVADTQSRPLYNIYLQ